MHCRGSFRRKDKPASGTASLQGRDPRKDIRKLFGGFFESLAKPGLQDHPEPACHIGVRIDLFGRGDTVIVVDRSAVKIQVKPVHIKVRLFVKTGTSLIVQLAVIAVQCFIQQNGYDHADHGVQQGNTCHPCGKDGSGFRGYPEKKPAVQK